ncbi:hypothetical protein F2Q68_00027198 [Brassica cretica]|uniref:Uncharacterized protein n=1 Tax=Brassica cretica TaxID=69181 RepID=A0A8S9I646_BRACR|nr:hypothetical protein F2Q68_00027198 [Brassica cretica]
MATKPRRRRQLQRRWSRVLSPEERDPIAYTLQENSGILMDIPTENKILGISRGISEDIPRKHKIWFPQNIPKKYQSVGIFLWNTEEKCIPRKKPMNSEDIL